MNQNQPRDAEGIVQHARLEYETLNHIKSALAGAVRADISEDELARKLANVRFTIASFQRFVERLFTLEEHDGYMLSLAESRPHLEHQIDEFRREHDSLRQQLRKAVVKLDSLSGKDAIEFGHLCEEILALIAKIDAHNHAETRMLQDAYNIDFGGGD